MITFVPSCEKIPSFCHTCLSICSAFFVFFSRRGAKALRSHFFVYFPLYGVFCTIGNRFFRLFGRQKRLIEQPQKKPRKASKSDAPADAIHVSVSIFFNFQLSIFLPERKLSFILSDWLKFFFLSAPPRLRASAREKHYIKNA